MELEERFRVAERLISDGYVQIWINADVINAVATFDMTTAVPNFGRFDKGLFEEGIFIDVDDNIEDGNYECEIKLKQNYWSDGAECVILAVKWTKIEQGEINW
jgi:hypothetical protein